MDGFRELEREDVQFTEWCGMSCQLIGLLDLGVTPGICLKICWQQMTSYLTLQWAYGVTLWEVLTMAFTPYPSLDTSEVFKFVENGGRLEQPNNCPDELWATSHSSYYFVNATRPRKKVDLFCIFITTNWLLVILNRFWMMTECWRVCPSDRPTFSKIADRIGQYLSDQLGYLYLPDATDHGYDIPV